MIIESPAGVACSPPSVTCSLSENDDELGAYDLRPVAIGIVLSALRVNLAFGVCGWLIGFLVTGNLVLLALCLIAAGLFVGLPWQPGLKLSPNGLG